MQAFWDVSIAKIDEHYGNLSVSIVVLKVPEEPKWFLKIDATFVDEPLTKTQQSCVLHHLGTATEDERPR